MAEICRTVGISQATFCKWWKQYDEMGLAELRELKQLREENRKLKQLVADLSLDKNILQEVPTKGSEGRNPAVRGELIRRGFGFSSVAPAA